MGAWLVTPDGHASYLLHAWSDDELQQAYRVKRLSMPFLELLAVVLAVLTWQKELASSVVEVRSDCKGVVDALTSDYSKSPQSHQLLLSLYMITTVNHITIRFSHIPGKDNVEADALSRAANRDTHRQDSLLESTFFSLPSVVCFLQDRLSKTDLPPYPSTIFMPNATASSVAPWRSQHTRRMSTA
jgi:ribonuclease HI